MDAGTTSWRLSLIWQCKRPSLVKKMGGCFAALSSSFQSEIQFLLVGVARERFIKGGWFVVGQVVVCGSGCYLTIGGGLGLT
uniref:Uncharacterized protein n=1 Tax=Romanomermis culicivorax TaxID=13658 RepID=A0A915IAW5_ROMCU